MDLLIRRSVYSCTSSFKEINCNVSIHVPENNENDFSTARYPQNLFPSRVVCFCSILCLFDSVLQRQTYLSLICKHSLSWNIIFRTHHTFFSKFQKVYTLTWWQVFVQAYSSFWLPIILNFEWGCRIHRLHLCRGLRPPPTTVLIMTLNNMMGRVQWCWRFGECGAHLPCTCSHVHTGQEW